MLCYVVILLVIGWLVSINQINQELSCRSDQNLFMHRGGGSAKKNFIETKFERL